MKTWRIQYQEQGITFSQSREQSMYIRTEEDVNVIRTLLPMILSWEDWKSFVENVRMAFLKGQITGNVHVCGFGMYRDLTKQADD